VVFPRGGDRCDLMWCLCLWLRQALQWYSRAVVMLRHDQQAHAHLAPDRNAPLLATFKKSYKATLKVMMTHIKTSLPDHHGLENPQVFTPSSL
jgi:hypothetical protein